MSFLLKICVLMFSVSVINSIWSHIWRLIMYVYQLGNRRGGLYIDASASNYTPYLLFWPALLLGFASCSVRLSPVVVVVLFLFLTNDLSSTSSCAGPSPVPVLMMMRHPSSLDATLTLQPITSSKSWAAMSALMRYHEDMNTMEHGEDERSELHQKLLLPPHGLQHLWAMAAAGRQR